ncbi:MAG: ATP synthase F0 subunit C [Myxococcota bacterium]
MKRIVSFATFLLTTLVTSAAFAQGWGGQGGGGSSDKAWYAFAAALAIGLPALGGALGQARASAAALESIGRNPNAADKIFTPMLLGLALIESLVIYGLIIAILLQNRL